MLNVSGENTKRNNKEIRIFIPFLILIHAGKRLFALFIKREAAENYFLSFSLELAPGL